MQEGENGWQQVRQGMGMSRTSSCPFPEILSSMWTLKRQPRGTFTSSQFCAPSNDRTNVRRSGKKALAYLGQRLLRDSFILVFHTFFSRPAQNSTRICTKMIEGAIKQFIVLTVMRKALLRADLRSCVKPKGREGRLGEGCVIVL